MRYRSLGNSGGEIARTLLFRPWKVVQAAFATPSHVGAVYGLLISFGLGIGLLSAAIIMAVPAVAELLFQETTTYSNFTALPVVPTLVIAVIYGLARLRRLAERHWGVDAARYRGGRRHRRLYGAGAVPYMVPAAHVSRATTTTRRCRPLTWYRKMPV